MGRLVWFFSSSAVLSVLLLASLMCMGGDDMGKRTGLRASLMPEMTFGRESPKKFEAKIPMALLDAPLKRDNGEFVPGTDEMQNRVFAEKEDAVFRTAGKFSYKLGRSPKLKIQDKREIDMITGKPVPDAGRKHADVPVDLVRDIAVAAIELGLDPYTELARGLQETNLDAPEWNMNVFHILDPTVYMAGKVDENTSQKDFLKVMMEKVKEKNRIARSLGKKSEEEILQAYNGYGTITSENNEYQTDSLYGVDLPIDMNKTPLYGQRLVDLRENVIKKNEEIVGMVERARQIQKISEAAATLGNLQLPGSR